MMVASCMIMLNLSEKEIRSYSYVDDFIVLFEKKADDGCRLNNRCLSLSSFCFLC